MVTPNAIVEQRNNIWHQMKDLLQRAKNEKRALSADEHQQFGTMDSQLNTLKLQLDTELRAADLEKEFNDLMDTNREVRGGGAPKETAQSAMARYIRSGVASPEDHRLLIEKRGTDTQRTTSDALGGYTVFDTWANSIYSTMKEFGGMLGLGYKFNTSTGADFTVPTDDNRATVGAVIAENTADVVLDEAFGVKTMKAFVITSKWIKATYEMLTDSGYDLEAYIQSRIGERLGRKLNAYLTVGAGTTEPYGVVPQTSLGKETASATAITRAEILGLVHSVDPAYRLNARFMFHDNILLAIKLLTIGTGDDRPLWQPGISAGAPDLLEGFPYTINQDMVGTQAAAAKVMLFGDFKKYWIREVWGVNLVSSKEKYIDSRAMAYNGYCRYDGLLVDTGAIKHLMNNDGA